MTKTITNIITPIQSSFDEPIYTVMNDKPNKVIRFIDLFAGIGGFRYSLTQCGCECVFSS